MTKKGKNKYRTEEKPKCIIEGCEKNAKKLGLYCRVHFWLKENEDGKRFLEQGLCRFCGERPVSVRKNGKKMKSCAECRAESTESKRKWREQESDRPSAPAAVLLLNRYNMMDDYSGIKQPSS